MDAMGVVDEPVEDGVGVGRMADQAMPFGDGKLAGDERGFAAVSILEDFEKVGAPLIRCFRMTLP